MQEVNRFSGLKIFSLLILFSLRITFRLITKQGLKGICRSAIINKELKKIMMNFIRTMQKNFY